MCCRLDFTQNLTARRIELKYMIFGIDRVPSARIRADVNITGATHGNAVQLTAELLLAQVPPVQMEPLQAAVFAVGDIEFLIGNRNIVRQIEFAGAGAVLAPFTQLLAICTVFDKAAVAVTVRDKNMVVGGEGRVGGGAMAVPGRSKSGSFDQPRQGPTSAVSVLRQEMGAAEWLRPRKSSGSEEPIHADQHLPNA